MKRQLVAAGIATAIGVAGITGIGVAQAATDTSSSSPMSGLVEAIASKFNLNKTEVQAVFDEQRSQMEAEREAEMKEKLATLVSEGTLTQAQADALTAKRAELQKEFEAARTSGERPSESDREARRTALETWAKEKGISTEYLYLLMGGGRGHGPGGPDGQRLQGTSQATN